ESGQLRTAFVLTAPATTAIAAAEPDAGKGAADTGKNALPKNTKVAAAAPAADAAKAKPPAPVPVALAYASAETDDATNAPFDAVMASPVTPRIRPKTSIVMPGIGAN